MPKKKATKTVKASNPTPKKVVKAPTPASKKAKTTKGSSKSVATKDIVGFRLRMTPGTHKLLVKMASKEGVSQNTLINNLIKDAE